MELIISQYKTNLYKPWKAINCENSELSLSW